MTLLDRPVPALLPSTRAESAGTELPQQVASRALAQASALVAWGWLATAPVVIVLGPESYDVPAFLLVVLGLGVIGGVGTAVIVRRPGALPAVAVGGLVAVAAAIAAFDVLSPVRGTPWNPALSLMGSACLVAGLVLRPVQAAAAALALALWHGWWDLGPPWTTGLAGQLLVLLTAAGAVSGARFVSLSLVRSSLQVSELVSGLLAERRAEQTSRVRERSLAAARTDLHDTILTTLSGIGAGWLTATDRDLFRTDVDRDVRLLFELDDAEDDGTADLVESVSALARAPMLEGLDVVVDLGVSRRVPAVVADALVLAAREALVNVVKHSGTRTVRIGVAHDGDDVRITIGDEGRGYDVDEPRSGLGLPGIAARMAEIGGSVRVRSTPGAGTTVVLERRAAPVQMPPLWSVEGPRRGALGLTLVSGGSQTVSFSLQAATYDDPTPQAIALALALVVDALVVRALLRGPTLPRWLSAVLVVRIPAVLLLTGIPLEDCAAMGYQHFSGGGELFIGIVVTLLRPRREAVTALAAIIASWVILAVPPYATGESCGITAVANSAIAIGLVVASAAFVAALHRHAAIAAEVLAAEEGLAAAHAAQQVRVAERRRLLPVVRRIATETLTGLADGRLDPADAAVRQRCRRDARLLRAFLTQAGDSDELITELFERSVRLRDTAVDLSVRGTLPRGSVAPVQRAALLSALDRCFTSAVDAGWRGEGLLTVLRAGNDVLLTVVLREVTPALPLGPLRMSLLDDEAPGLTLNRAEASDGDLWITFRLSPATSAT